jgi:hypothetical protein
MLAQTSHYSSIDLSVKWMQAAAAAAVTVISFLPVLSLLRISGKKKRQRLLCKQSINAIMQSTNHRY